MTIEKISVRSTKSVCEEIMKIRCPVQRFATHTDIVNNRSIHLQRFAWLESQTDSKLYIFFQRGIANNELIDILDFTSYHLFLSNNKRSLKFEGKMWIENEHGEKCLEEQCKLILKLAINTNLLHF